MMSQQEPPPTGLSALEQDPVRLTMDQDSVREPSAQWALSLLREATPYQAAPGHKERAWLALPAPRSYRPARLRFALAVVALLASGVFATGALAQWPVWLANAIDRIVPGAPGSLSTTPAEGLRRARSERVAVPALLPPPESEPVVTRQTPASEETPSVAKLRRATRSASPEDLGPLLDAMRALRVEHNPVRARALLAAYLDRHGKGELSEEALVMLIEAAATHHDSDAPALAARYLKLYPRGTFRGLVERTLATAANGP
jgi:hypothetical protein